MANVYPNRGRRTEPQYNLEGTSATTRYTYARPTEKPQPKKEPITSYNIDDYGLPVIDVQTARRNFPGYAEAQVYSLEDMQGGDISGATDTDAYTHEMKGKNSGGGYTKINQRMGKFQHVPIRSTSARARNN